MPRATRFRQPYLTSRGTLKRALDVTVEAVLALAARLGVRVAPPRVSIHDLVHRTSDVTFEELQPGEHVPIAAPFLAIDREPDRFAAAIAAEATGYDTSAGGVITLKDARFEFPSGLVSIGGVVPHETLLEKYWPHSYYLLPALRMSVARSSRVEGGAIVTLAHWRNVYHWIVEMLPMALMLTERHPGIPLFIPESRPRFVTEYLRLLGMESRCLDLPNGVYEASPLYVAAIPGCGLNRPSPLNVERIRAALLTRVASPPPRTRRLYISRQDAERRVRNEAELINVLTDYGFDVITPGELSVLDQLTAFAGAECIVGTHGAGLANMIVAPQQCSVIEILGNRVVNPTFLILASILGLQYAYVRGSDAGVPKALPTEFYGDLIAPLEDTRRAVETVLAGL